MAVSAAHTQRIKRELADAGMTAYGQFKMSSRHLPKIIEKDEHIHGVVYGWRAGGLAMLVATDERIIYLERRPLFSSVDDISYDVVAGVRVIDAGLFPSVDLHTRMGDYMLTYVNPRCAGRFAKYIERRIERPETVKVSTPIDKTPDMPEIKTVSVAEEVRAFLKANGVGVLSTTNRTGQVNGVAVYYIFGDDNCLYIMTKSDTAKTHNMMANHQVAFTVFDAAEIKTAQIQGYAEIEADYESKRRIFEQLVSLRNYGGEILMSPVAQLSAGGFIAFKITPIDIHYADYKKSGRNLQPPPTSW